MKKKKIVSVFLICIFSFMLIGCEAKDVNNKESADSKTTSSNDNVEQSKKIDEGEKTKTDSSKETKSEDAVPNEKKENINNNTKQTSENNSSEGFYGTWTISKDLSTNKQITTYSTEDINSIKGKTLTFSKDKATAFGDSVNTIKETIENPIYKKNVIPKAKFEAEWRITFKDLGIEGDTVTEVSVSSNKNSNTCDFLIVNDNTLILCGGGEYFELKK